MDAKTQKINHFLTESKPTNCRASPDQMQRNNSVATTGPVSSLVKGKNFDNVYKQKNEELADLKNLNKDLLEENRQFKILNERLLGKIDLLTNVIEKEASAYQYYHDYPPKFEEFPKIKSKFN